MSDPTPDPRVVAIGALLEQYSRDPLGISGSIGWGAAIEDILAAADAVDPLRQPGLLHLKDDDSLRDALAAWFGWEVTYERFVAWSDGKFGEHLLSLLRGLAVPVPTAKEDSQNLLERTEEGRPALPDVRHDLAIVVCQVVGHDCQAYPEDHFVPTEDGSNG